MKSILPALVVIVFLALSFGACSKKSSSGCTCKAIGASGKDTVFTETKPDSGYTLSTECALADSFYKSLLGSTYGCHM